MRRGRGIAIKPVRDLGPRAIYNLRRRIIDERINNLNNVENQHNGNDNDGDGRADQHPREDVNIIPDRADDRADHPMEDLHLVLPQDRAPMPIPVVDVRGEEDDNEVAQNEPQPQPNANVNELEAGGNNDDDQSDEDEGIEEEVQESDDDSDEEEHEAFDAIGIRPLYAGAEITVKETMILMLSLMLRHNLTSTCVGDIFTILKLICPRNGFQSLSLYKFTKYFALVKPGKYKKHFYCFVCQSSLAAQDAECNICIETKKVSYFLELPFLKQLQEMLKRDNFYQLLQHRFHRDIQRQDLVSDICDGDLYATQAQNGFLSDPNGISFMWYTDGVPVFNSSKTSMWPIYLSICELPYKYRIRQENILLAGLWFGKKHPEPNLYLSKLRGQFQTLFNGKNFTLPGGNIVRIRGIILAGTGDVPAKTLFMCLTLYSGAWGCTVCKAQGRTFMHNTGGHSHIFPYDRHIQERTSEETIALGTRVVLERPENGIEGVRGLSALRLLMPDFQAGMSSDPMHKVWGGTCKKLLYLWFDSSYAAQPFSLKLVIASIDKRLTSIKPPKHVHRMPHSITELCHWKCSELKMWFFYFALPVLSGIMQPLYFNHFSLFVLSISLLNKDIITRADVRKANKLLHKFVREFQELYGERQMTINVHGLLHLPAVVNRLGGLYNYSCMPYEDLNGRLLKHIHGTSNLDSQLAVRHSQVIKLQNKLETLRDGPVRDFVINWKKRQVTLNERIFQGCYSVGKYQSLEVLPAEIRRAFQNMNFNPGSFKTYHRLLKDSKLFVSESYPRSMKSNSAYVLFQSGGVKRVGCISVFARLTHCNCNDNCQCEVEHYAILNGVVTENVFETVDDNNVSHSIWHLKQCRKGNVVSAVPVRDLVTVCVYISWDANNQFIGFPVNDLEKE